MAEAAVETARNPFRFFCHRCNVEFEDNVQNDTCPFCATGFIEQLEHNESLLGSLDEDYSDAEMSNLDDTGNTEEGSLGSNSTANEVPPVLNDLAFLMSGGRSRAGGIRPPRQETLMEQLVWMIGGGRAGTGAVTAGVAGAPFVLVGSPGDYVFGGEGLDAVVTQLLGQLENTGPPPLAREQIAAIASHEVTAAQVEAAMTCSVCWDSFSLGESVSKLECEHIFHPGCITPWLQLHATCPICRRSLLPPHAPPAPGAPPRAPGPRPPPATQPEGGESVGTRASLPRVVVRRYQPARRRAAPGTDSSSTGSNAASVGGLWANLTSSLSSLANTDTSSTSLNSSDRDRYMDIDYD